MHTSAAPNVREWENVTVARRAAAPVTERVGRVGRRAGTPANQHTEQENCAMLAVDRIVECDRTDTEAIAAFFRGDDHLALRIPDFVPPEFCDRVGQALIRSGDKENYGHEVLEHGQLREVFLGVQRIGVPFNSTYGKPQGSPQHERYYRAAQTYRQWLRDLCAPDTPPIEQFVAHADAAWPGGARIASFEGREQYAGICRITLPGHGGIESPHCDSLPPEFGITRQFGVNVFLTAPAEGGEMELWDVPDLDATEIHSDNMARLERENLPESYLLKPRAGDLVIINTRKPHATRSYAEGTRVALASFVGHGGDGPLLFWS